MQSAKVTCDECGGDLTYTNNYGSAYLALSNVNRRGKRTFDPLLKSKQHFCDFVCLYLFHDRARVALTEGQELALARFPRRQPPREDEATHSANST
jgi:hypothetical protein